MHIIFESLQLTNKSDNGVFGRVFSCCFVCWYLLWLLQSLVTSLVMEISLFVGRIWNIGRRPVWVWLSYFCAFGKWPAVSMRRGRTLATLRRSLEFCGPRHRSAARLCCGTPFCWHIRIRFGWVQSPSRAYSQCSRWRSEILPWSETAAWSLLCHARRRMPRSSPVGAHVE